MSERSQYSKNTNQEENDDRNKQEESQSESNEEVSKSESNEEVSKSESSDSNDKDNTNKKFVSCLGITVPCDNGDASDTECPLLPIQELDDLEQYICDKDYNIDSLEEFKIKQTNSLFEPNQHYWFQVRPDNTIRYISPYAEDMVLFFQEHYYIDNIGHSSMLTLEEFVDSYNKENPGKYVLYAGTWQTDENGKIIYWSNDSGHYTPSSDFAAPVAEAMGITDALFVPWIDDTEEYSIFYRQYQDYTGAYHAKMETANTIGGGGGEDMEKIFYPHNYHKWYKYHGEKGEYTGNNNHFNGHLNGHNIVNNGIGFLWVGLFVAVLCCMIGIIISFVMPKNKQKHMYQKNESMVLSEVSEQNNEEYDDQIHM